MSQTVEQARQQERHRQQSQGSRSWFGTTLFLLVLAFLAFLAGAYVVLDKVPPYRFLKAAYSAGKAGYYQLTGYQNPLQTDLWAAARTDARGVTVHDPAKAYEGYTLYTSGHEAAAYLMDMDGKVVHEWRLPFSDVWDETSVVEDPRPDPFVFMRKAWLYPNGDILALYEGAGDTPWGLGLVKMDKESKLLWKYLDERTHHDVTVGEDGRIYALTHRIRDHEVERFRHLEPPLIEDSLLILSPDGEVEAKVSLLDALAESPYGRFLATVPSYAQQDPLHTNAVEPIEGEAAANFPHAGAGSVLLSFRDTGLIAAFDPKSKEFVWGMRGPWIGQHDPDILPNGNVLLFDNLGDVGPGGNSRVIELDRETLGIVWSYDGTEEKPLFSVLRSEQQRLPNGNTLITEAEGGRLFEVTREGEIVWEYINPVRAGEGDKKIPVVSWGQRFTADQLDPALLGR